MHWDLELLSSWTHESLLLLPSKLIVKYVLPEPLLVWKLWPTRLLLDDVHPLLVEFSRFRTRSKTCRSSSATLC